MYTGNIGYLDSIRNAGTDFTITNYIVSQVLPGFYWLLEVVGPYPLARMLR
jgi:hypothetical protein